MRATFPADPCGCRWRFSTPVAQGYASGKARAGAAREAAIYRKALSLSFVSASGLRPISINIR